MNIDFKNDFYASCALVLFAIMAAAGVVWLFAALWAAAGFWGAVILFVPVGLLFAWPAGMLLAVLSFVLALPISGLRWMLGRKQQA